MLRAKPDIPVFINLFVVPADGINPGLRCCFVEPHLRKGTSGAFNPGHCRALALIWHDLDRIAGIGQGALVRHVIDLVVGVAVMRQPDRELVACVALLPQPVEVRCQWLALRLVVIEYPDFLADKLGDPNRECVCIASGAANVDKRPQAHQWISSYTANASLG